MLIDMVQPREGALLLVPTLVTPGLSNAVSHPVFFFASHLADSRCRQQCSVGQQPSRQAHHWSPGNYRWSHCHSWPDLFPPLYYWRRWKFMVNINFPMLRLSLKTIFPAHSSRFVAKTTASTASSLSGVARVSIPESPYSLSLG